MNNWPQFPGVRAADGKMITTWEPMELRVELGGREVTTSACAADVTEPVTLELPASKSLGAMVGLASSKLWIGKCQVLFHREWKMGLPQIRRVSITKGCVMPLWSEICHGGD